MTSVRQSDVTILQRYGEELLETVRAIVEDISAIRIKRRCLATGSRIYISSPAFGDVENLKSNATRRFRAGIIYNYTPRYSCIYRSTARLLTAHETSNIQRARSLDSSSIISRRRHATSNESGRERKKKERRKEKRREKVEKKKKKGANNPANYKSSSAGTRRKRRSLKSVRLARCLNVISVS